MNKKLNVMIIAGLLAIVLLLAVQAYNFLSKKNAPDALATLSPTESSEAKQSAPDFTVYDLAGNPYTLSQFRGKPVVLNFWASWCGPCKSEMPDFDAAYAKYGQDIHFLMVNLTDGYQETEETAAAYISQQGYDFPVYYDSDMDAAATYGISGVPVTYFIDAEGYFVAMAQGALSAEGLERGIGMLTE